ncbi:MAG TPA: hypothetical protein VJ417_11045 [Candidatus Glassbacteria bacterium]|nr:hypothetical protein [Candidatus Glassbacteria bacterium]
MSRTKFCIIIFQVLALLAVFSLSSCGSRPPEPPNTQAAAGWEVVGPGGGGGMFLPTFSPHDKNLILEHCDMTAAYISQDGGSSWRTLNLWNVPEAFEFDPKDPEAIYVAVRGFSYSEDRGSGLSVLYRSQDRGKTWQAVYPDVSKAIFQGELQAEDLLPSQIVDGAFDGTIERVQVDPADNRIIYLGMAPLRSYISMGFEQQQNQAMLIISTDRGATWKKLCDLPGRSVVEIVPAAEGKLLVFTEREAVEVDRASGTGAALTVPEVGRIVAVAWGKDRDGTTIYLLSSLRREGENVTGGVFRSRDLGHVWQPVNTGLFEGVPEGQAPQISAIAACETDPTVAYVSVRNSREAREDSSAWVFGIFKTENSGDNWKGVWLANGAGYLTNNHQGSWLDKQWGPGWGGNPIHLGVAPTDPNTCIGSDAGRSYKTEDGGANWRQIHSRNNPDGSVSSTGLNVTTCYGVHFDPFDLTHFFITYTDIGLFHSLDGGKSWLHSVAGVPPRWTNTCYWLVFDPEVRGRLWSVWGNAHDLPRDKMFSPRGFENNQGGVAVSDDGGRTWKKSNEGIPENSVGTNILVDPGSSAGSRTLYATMFGRGVYKSTDGGATWNEANNGLGENHCAWKLALNGYGRIFLVLSRGRGFEQPEGNQRPGITTVDGELYYSDDGAANWQKLALPAGENAPHDLQIDPAAPERMFLSCWAVEGDRRDVGGGLYRSTDGGQTWKLVFDKVRRINSSALDPRFPGRIYLNTFQNAAFRSDDYGDTWRRIEGYRFKWGQRVIPDQADPALIYLTTYGGSVFHGPADGTPGAEDVTNLPQSWW